MTALIGTPLGRVRDPRLAATILMIQLVRTGSPITDAEHAKIIELMGTPLRIDDLSGMFETAWGYTEERRPFGLVADELVPMLLERLAEPERRQLTEMLTAVADANSDAGDLQTAAITRLERQLQLR